MSRGRLSMRKIREVLGLKYERGQSNRVIARSCSLSKTTVGEYLRRHQLSGLGWPLSEDLDDSAIDERLFPKLPLARDGRRPVPQWSKIHQELKRKGVTLQLLWQEYKEADSAGYQYSWFCCQYGRWIRKLDLVMRQNHRAGEKLFVDYAGQTVPVFEPGGVVEAQIFVAVLGASNYTYAEPTRTQGLQDWNESHVRAFRFFGAVPELVIPDNLKSGVTKPCRYEPDLNPTYRELARHFGVTVIPARVRKPRDKAKVEVGVQVVERWVLARLRNHKFFSFGELNQAIRELLVELNDRKFRKIDGTRRSLFETLERPAMQALPETPYEYAEWHKARAGMDYHVELDGHYYSVPYVLVKEKLEVRATARIVEVFHKGKRVASHARSNLRGAFTTVRQHMPKPHQRYADWTPQKLAEWARRVGEATARVAEEILCSRPHPQQGFRSCLGLRRLEKEFGTDRLEAACRRALSIKAYSYTSIQSILKNDLDGRELDVEVKEDTPALEHHNIRGPEYFASARRERARQEAIILEIPGGGDDSARDDEERNQGANLPKDMKA